MGDHVSFVQEVTWDLQCFPMILAFCVVEDASKHVDILSLGILSNLRAFSNCIWEKSDIASAGCPSQPGNLAITSIIFAAVVWDADEPCSVNIASAPESSFLFVSLCFQNSSLLLPISHAGLVSSLFHSLSTAAFASDIFSACGTPNCIKASK